jgi:hypothetical protein
MHVSVLPHVSARNPLDTFDEICCVRYATAEHPSYVFLSS